MAEKVFIALLIVAAVLLLSFVVWLIISEYMERQNARQRERDFLKAMQELEQAAGLAANTEPVKRKDTDQGASQAEPQRVGKPSSEDKKPVKYERFRMKRRDVTVNLKPQREEDRTQDRGRE